MGNRGRPSSAALSVVPPLTGPIVSTPRPAPPADLTPEQADEWLAVTGRMPADWFPRETFGLLSQYCRHVVAARRIADLIGRLEAKEEFEMEEYDRLLKMQDREGRALSSLAIRMRIAQHAQYDKKKTKGSVAQRPWDSPR
jgi:hypothetical protein